MPPATHVLVPTISRATVAYAEAVAPTSRPGGAELKCYPKDVTKTEIDTYRAQHR
jgi:hypothetical protein